jgi:hypothetical protein
MHKRNFAFIVSIFLLFAGCGGSDSKTSAGAGSIAFGVIWQGAPTLTTAFDSQPETPDATLISRAQLDCNASGVSTVSASAYNASNSVLASGGPWNCSAHSGTINNIPAQSNITVVVLGNDSSGNVLYRGEKTGIPVTAGQIYSAGTITATIFAPTLAAPISGSTVTNGFSFTWTGSGASYEIMVSNDSGFTSTVIDATVTTTSYVPTSALSDGTYYWRVKSFDSYGNASAWSAVGSFTAIAPSSAKAITAFSFTSPAATGTIDENAKTIAISVPYGTNVTALIATFITTGANVKVGSTIQVSGQTPNNFTNPVTYIVTAADGTTASYTVTVTVAASSAKAITAFLFTSPAATGTIDENAKTIAVTVPYGTNVTALVATFTTTGVNVRVGATTQVTGTTPNNFTNPVAYVVTAADGTTATYTVTVTIAPPAVVVPAAPTGLIATAMSSTIISLSWTDNSDNETGFKIERSSTSASTGFTPIATTNENVTIYNDSGLNFNKPYWYRVKAYNSAGDSTYSNVATATTQHLIIMPMLQYTIRDIPPDGIPDVFVGGGGYPYLSIKPGTEDRALMQFDIYSVPTNITNADLKIYIDTLDPGGSTGTITVYYWEASGFTDLNDFLTTGKTLVTSFTGPNGSTYNPFTINITIPITTLRQKGRGYIGLLFVGTGTDRYDIETTNAAVSDEKPHLDIY